jgi:hypothetical protein
MLNQESKSNSHLLDGFSYTFHKMNKDQSRRFKCKCFCSEEECTATIKILVDGSIISSGQHTDGCSRKNGKTVVLREANFAGGDVTHSMHQWVEERCLSVQHSHEIAKTIWQDCVAHFSKTCGDNFSGLSRDQVTNLVHNNRNRAYGTNAIPKVELQYTGSKWHVFLQQSKLFSDKKGCQRMMAFSSKELLSLLEYPKVNECVVQFTHLLQPKFLNIYIFF